MDEKCILYIIFLFYLKKRINEEVKRSKGQAMSLFFIKT